MLLSKPNAHVAILSLVISALMSSCLPQQSSSSGASKRIVNSGQSNGADSSSPTTTGTQTNTQSASTSSPSIQTADGNCYKADVFACKIERMIAEKTNKYRASRGLQPLTLDSKISFVARDWSQKQSNKGFIGHMGFPSARQSVYRSEFNESRSLNGENVAYTGMLGRSGQQDDAAAERVAEAFAVMWWNSSGHRRNMLGNFRNIGVGIAQRSSGDWYATQIFN
jgi:uncharacterized protein YkwD